MQRAQYAANREQILLRRRTSYQANREDLLTRSRARYAADPDRQAKHRAEVKAWKEANPAAADA